MNFIRIVWLLAIGFSAQCAVLSIDQVAVQAGATVPIAVRLASAGTQVAALQFDLSYDPTMAFAASAGPASVSAAKHCYSAALALGSTRFLLAGTNRSLLGDGPVVSLTALMRSSAAIGSYPLRMTNLVASDLDGKTVPLTGADGSVTVDGSASLPPSRMFAQVASGGGWKTSFTLLNLSATANGANLTFWADAGTPLALPMTFSPELEMLPAAGFFTDIVIPPNGVAVVETELPETSTASTGWARLIAPADVVGSATFGYHGSVSQNLEVVVPLETRSPASFVLPFDNTAGVVTGVALASGSDTLTASITVTARDAAGGPLFTDLISLPVRGHTSFMLADKYPGLNGVLGSLEFQNSNGGNISVLGLRINPSGSLTSIPVEARQSLTQ